MEPSVLVALLSLLGAPLAAFIGYRLNKDKTDNDISTSIASASGDAVEAIRGVLHELQIELKDTKIELLEFKQQNKDLELGLVRLNSQNDLLLKQNNKLGVEITELRKQIDRLSREENA